MAAAGAHSAGGHAAGRGDVGGKTPAQWYCLLGGAALLLAGIAGFLVDSTFDTGSNLNGDKLLFFEVNGWHNIVHLLSGLLLLGAAAKRVSAKTVAILFGVTYGAVALYGLIDGSDVLGLIPINGADNLLHIALAAAGILAGLVSRAGEPLRTSTATPRDEAAAGKRGFGREDAPPGTMDPLSGRPFGEKTANR
jgi:hypothetical protein